MMPFHLVNNLLHEKLKHRDDLEWQSTTGKTKSGERFRAWILNLGDTE